MRRTFEYWFSVDFKEPENREGCLILPKYFEQPIRRIRPLYCSDRKSGFKQCGFQIGLGYVDYKNEDDYLLKRSADAERLREKNKKYIENCKNVFEKWVKEKQKGVVGGRE